MAYGIPKRDGSGRGKRAKYKDDMESYNADDIE